MSIAPLGWSTRSAARLIPPSLRTPASSKPLFSSILSNLVGLGPLAAAAEARLEEAEAVLTTGTGSFLTPRPASKTVSRFVLAPRGNRPSSDLE